MHDKYVIALGGNAIDDIDSISKSAAAIAKLYSKGNDIIITHGNGPQVGMLSERMDMDLAVLTAQTQAWIGAEISKCIADALNELGIKHSHSIPEIVITYVAVNRNYGRLAAIKPIGRYMSRLESRRIVGKGFKVKKFNGGYRRVVPSPYPIAILQNDVIDMLTKRRKIAIACGGGGIPIMIMSGRMEYADAVIDKDRSSALLAKELKASRFFILTNVDGAYNNFGKSNQKLIERITADDLAELIKKGGFEEGSMKPKLESCIDFVKSCKRSAGIGNMSNPDYVFSLKHLTLVTP